MPAELPVITDGQRQNIAEREAFRLREVAANFADSEQLRSELAMLGFRVASTADLRHKYDYRAVVPLLIRWLPRLNRPDSRADLVRSLTVRWARPEALDVVLAEMEREPSSDVLQFAVANALTVIADDSAYDRIAAWALDVRFHEDTRATLGLALGSMQNPAAPDVLVRMLGQEPGVREPVLRALRRVGRAEHLPAVEAFLDDPHKPSRLAAEKAVKWISARVAKGTLPKPRRAPRKPPR